VISEGLAGLGLLGLFGVLFLKEMGVPIPFPGDLLVLGAGVAAANGDLDPGMTLGAILLAGFLGGSVQFVVLRGGLRRPLLALLDRLGLRRARVEREAERLRARGVGGVALSRATPGVRVVAIAASALAALPFTSFLAGLVIGNTFFVGLHFLLGLVVGAPALQIMAGLGVGLTAVGVALTGLGLAAWWLLRRRRAAARTQDVVTDWADATCPICLTLGLAGVNLDEGSSGLPG